MITNPEAILNALDPDQREAVEATRGPVCIIAGAGTGKTRVITHRVAYAIATGVTDSSKSLALTFTARAAGEMRTRLRDLGVANANARTFHSAALKQLMYFWPHTLGGAFPKLLPGKAPLIANAIGSIDTYITSSQSNLRDISGEIEWAKALEIPPHLYVESALENGRSLRFPNAKDDKVNLSEVAKVYERYEYIKKQERVIDFEDVLLLTVGMLEEDRAVRERVRDQYRYFTVDEYQDVSPLQQRLLNLWLGNREELCVVGDPSQTIYSFAGATSVFLLSFTQRFPQAKVVRLSRGYRSTPEIIRAANKILRDAEQTHEHHELVSMNESGDAFSLDSFDSASAEIQGVADSIKSLLATIDSTDIAVLARTNTQIDSMEKALNSIGIQTQIKGSERFFDRTDVKDALKVIRQASVIPSEDWQRDLDSILNPFNNADFVVALKNLAQESGATSMRAFLRDIEERAEQNNPPTLPGVTLSTLHAAKGMEWKRVFLVGVADGSLPLSSARTSREIEEERRLLYVGLTRAQAHLSISYAGKPSPFLTSIK